ncbi:MAG: polyhydroxyalkanoic acid system family protein [Pirellulaceae bacterium]|nr:polyhydroxyalkanoic acid system family protein [Pirellulaceae bacterium]
MPKITVRIAHEKSAVEALARVRPALEKTAKDFQGHDLQMDSQETTATFAFKSMAFTIKGTVEASAAEVVVNVDLPFAAMMFKDQAERAVAKNVKRALEPPLATPDAPPPQT